MSKCVQGKGDVLANMAEKHPTTICVLGFCCCSLKLAFLSDRDFKRERKQVKMEGRQIVFSYQAVSHQPPIINSNFK